MGCWYSVIHLSREGLFLHCNEQVRTKVMQKVMLPKLFSEVIG